MGPFCFMTFFDIIDPDNSFRWHEDDFRDLRGDCDLPFDMDISHSIQLWTTGLILPHNFQRQFFCMTNDLKSKILSRSNYQIAIHTYIEDYSDDSLFHEKLGNVLVSNISRCEETREHEREQTFSRFDDWLDQIRDELIEEWANFHLVNINEISGEWIPAGQFF